MILLLSLLLSSATAIDVLWLGNSYTYVNDVPATVSRLAEAAGQGPISYDSHLEGGWSWKKHAESEITVNLIQSKKWDVVILQEYSLAPAYNTSRVCQDTVVYLDQLVQLIRQQNPTTIIQFYLTWGRPYGDQSECRDNPQFCTYEAMQTALSLSYTTFACMNQPARVTPVGEAFRYVKENIDEDTFYSLYNTNGVSDHHASPRGSYLSALLHFRALFNTSPVGNTETGGLSADIAEVLQRVAEDTWQSSDWDYPEMDGCTLCMCNCAV